MVYWLAAQARVVHTPVSRATRLGWQTSANHWNDAAVWVKAEESYDGAAWKPSTYPKGHPFGGKQIDLAFTIESEKPAAGTVVRRMVADDWTCRSAGPVTGVVWWGSYLGSGYLPCECPLPPGAARPELAPPQPPDYFLLSIWTDGAGSGSKDAMNVSHPGKKIWEYKADQFDEVLVGFDKDPAPTSSLVQGFEPVYRYTVGLPRENWFRADAPNSVYWLSVVAVYKDGKNVLYPWGWTNHPSVSGDQQKLTPPAGCKPEEMAAQVAADETGRHGNAVVGRVESDSTRDVRVEGTDARVENPPYDWTPLLDPTGQAQDMSFMFFTEPPQTPGGDIFIGTDPDDGSVEIVIPARK